MKAVLVVEMPTCCEDCELHGKDMEGVYCLYRDEKGYTKKYKGIPSWCPLRPLPQEREFGKRNILPIKVDGNSFVLGWNACLKEIEK